MTNENAVKGMSIKKKALIVLCALVSVVVIVATSVLATIAYLTATAAVSNVFTVGNVSLTMDEAKVKPDGTYVTDATNRGDTNTYNLIPGASYIKDPVIHVAAGSQASYLFITIKNDIATLADPDKPSIAAQLKTNGWAKLAHQSVGDIYVYVGAGNVADNGEIALTATKTDVIFSTVDDYPLFNQFSIDESHKDLSLYASAKITINAFAIQNTGLETVVDAWNALVETYSTYLNIEKITVNP